ncbi:MAG TPA: hypothetical protein VM118_12340 [Acidobacteriota bacterium]|nr:hypothetical protein [Acidobacteriota bacterium]
MTRTTHRTFLPILLTAALAAGLFSGCASIMNGGSQDVAFETTPPSAVVTAYDAAGTDSISCQSPCSLKLERRKRYFVSIRKPGYESAGMYLRRRTSKWLYANILSWSIPGVIVDLADGRAHRFDPGHLSIDLSGSLGGRVIRGDSAIAASRATILSRYSRKTRPVSYTNKLILSLTIPEGNWFYYLHSRKHVNQFGFLGLLVGLEYYPADDYFYSAKFGVATTFILPFPVVYDPVCVSEGVGEILFQAQYNRNLSRFSVGGGLHWLYSAARRTIISGGYCNRDVSRIEEYDVDGQSLGLSLSVQRRIGSSLHLDANYLPTIFLKDGRGFHPDYSHTVYFGVTWKTALMSL